MRLRPGRRGSPAARSGPPAGGGAPGPRPVSLDGPPPAPRPSAPPKPPRQKKVRRRRGRRVQWPATLAGMSAAFGLTVLVAELVAGVGSVGYQIGVEDEHLSNAGAVVALVVLIGSFVMGGWVAGRIARTNVVRNGVFTAVWFVVVMALAALRRWRSGEGDQMTAELRQLRWFGDETTSAWTALAAGVGVVIVILAAGAFGGWLGGRPRKGGSKGSGSGVVSGSGGVNLARQGAAPHPR